MILFECLTEIKDLLLKNINGKRDKVWIAKNRFCRNNCLSLRFDELFITSS
jgi:hypothetical protein